MKNQNNERAQHGLSAAEGVSKTSHALRVWQIRLLIVFALFALLISVPVLIQRVRSEAANNSAETVFDYASLKDYARANGLTLEAVLARCRDSGIAGIAVEELGRDSLALDGKARTATYFEILDLKDQGLLPKGLKPDPMCSYYLAENSKIAGQICRGALFSLGQDRARVLPDDSGRLVELKCDPRALVNLGLGIPLDVVENLHKKGFKVWIRPWNSANLTRESLKELMELYGRLNRENKIEGIIFGGIRNEVYGYPNDIPYIAELFKNTGLELGVIELAPKAQQKGIIKLAKLLNDHAVRVMAVSSAHQSKLEPETVVSMFSLGIRERGMRVVYCRPYFDGVEKRSVEEVNRDYLQKLHEEIVPYFHGAASGYPEDDGLLHFKPGLNWPCMFLLLILLAEYFIVGLTAKLLHCGAKVQLEIQCAFIASFLAAPVLIGGKFWAFYLTASFWAITVLPIAGFVLAMPIWERAERNRGLWTSLKDGLLVLGVTAAFSWVGGLIASALLSDINFMLSLNVFRGVKFHSLLVPSAVFLIWLVMQHKRGGLSGVWHFLNIRVRVWHVLLFTVLLAGAAFYVVRTGNMGGDLVVSDSERLFRTWLDSVLGVRPRFKEFLLGNPALMLLPLLVSLRWRPLVPFAVIAGAVGMASLSDTYAHIHTPLLISVHRSFNGLVIGCIIGSAAGFAFYSMKYAYLRIFAKDERSEAQAEQDG
ncbi:hypothetical protein IJT93_12975 [bacterium]|nr:hypothetical protein [bacterium]